MDGCLALARHQRAGDRRYGHDRGRHGRDAGAGPVRAVARDARRPLGIRGRDDRGERRPVRPALRDRQRRHRRLRELPGERRGGFLRHDRSRRPGRHIHARRATVGRSCRRLRAARRRQHRREHGRHAGRGRHDQQSRHHHSRGRQHFLQRRHDRAEQRRLRDRGRREPRWARRRRYRALQLALPATQRRALGDRGAVHRCRRPAAARRSGSFLRHHQQLSAGRPDRPDRPRRRCGDARCGWPADRDRGGRRRRDPRRERAGERGRSASARTARAAA